MWEMVVVRMFDRMPDDVHRRRRAEPSPVFHRLRFMASCALGGALLTGAIFGHDLSGFDPRSIGAAVGLLASVVAMLTRAA